MGPKPRRAPPTARRPARLRGDAPDREIVAAWSEHPEAFELVFERHHASVWRFLARVAGREHADDLAGDVFVTAFHQRDRYDPDRGSLRAWLYGIAANLARMRLRSAERGGRAHERLARATDRVQDPIGELEDALVLRQRVESVAAAFAELAPADREVLGLYAADDLSYDEIAEELGVPVGTVRSRISRARGRLRELLPDNGQHPGELARSSDGAGSKEP